MAYSYKKLWILLIKEDMSKSTLRQEAKLSTTTLARLGKNQGVSLEALSRICKVLECNIGDIIDYVKE